MPWVVVELFPHKAFEDITVQTVPQSWVCDLRDHAYILYPPDTHSSPVIERMIRKQHQPMISWEKLYLKFVTAPFDDMNAARQLEIQMADCEDTDLESFVGNLERGKNKRKRKARDFRYPNEPESGSDFTDGDDVLSSPPSPPDIMKRKRKQKKAISRRCGKKVELEPSSTTASVCFPSTRSGPDSGSSASADSSLNEFKSFFQKELNNLKSEIRVQMNQGNAQIKKAIDALSMHLRSSPLNLGDHPEEMDLLHTLPMVTMEELIDFDKVITYNSSYRQFMVLYLRDRSSNLLYRSVNEKSFTAAVNKTVNDVCSMLMSNEMGQKFCMKGRTLYKTSFEISFPRIIDLIFDTLKTKRVNGPQLEVITIKRSIGEWFRLARLRGGAAKSLEVAQGT